MWEPSSGHFRYFAHGIGKTCWRRFCRYIMSESVFLPKNVRPRKYTLFLDPSLETFEFQGKLTIDLDVVESCSAITFHADRLEIFSVSQSTISCRQLPRQPPRHSGAICLNVEGTPHRSISLQSDTNDHFYMISMPLTTRFTRFSDTFTQSTLHVPMQTGILTGTSTEI